MSVREQPITDSSCPVLFVACSRQRPALGECLANLAAAMPVAYLEPSLNEFNAFSVYTTKTPRERSSQYSSISRIYHLFNNT